MSVQFNVEFTGFIRNKHQCMRRHYDSKYGNVVDSIHKQCYDYSMSSNNVLMLSGYHTILKKLKFILTRKIIHNT